MKRYLIFACGILVTTCDHPLHALIIARREANEQGMAMITDQWTGYNQYIQEE